MCAHFEFEHKICGNACETFVVRPVKIKGSTNKNRASSK